MQSTRQIIYNALIFGALFGLSSCSNPLTKVEDLNQIKTSVKFFTASECQEVCSSIKLEISVENNTSIPMCFSSRYLTSSVSKSIYLFSSDHKTLYDDFRVAYDGTDSAPDVPGHEREHVMMLRAEPNIIVQPHSKLDYVASTGDKYKLPNLPMNVQMTMYLYPCDSAQFTQYGYVRRTSEVSLSFEPFTSKGPIADSSASVSGASE